MTGRGTCSIIPTKKTWCNRSHNKRSTPFKKGSIGEGLSGKDGSRSAHRLVIRPCRTGFCRAGQAEAKNGAYPAMQNWIPRRLLHRKRLALVHMISSGRQAALGKRTGEAAKSTLPNDRAWKRFRGLSESRDKWPQREYLPHRIRRLVIRGIKMPGRPNFPLYR